MRMRGAIEARSVRVSSRTSAVAFIVASVQAITVLSSASRPSSIARPVGSAARMATICSVIERPLLIGAGSVVLVVAAGTVLGATVVGVVSPATVVGGNVVVGMVTGACVVAGCDGTIVVGAVGAPGWPYAYDSRSPVKSGISWN